MERHCEAETLITVTLFEAVEPRADFRGFMIAGGLLKVWLWTASLRRGWRVFEEDDDDEEEEFVDCWVC